MYCTYYTGWITLYLFLKYFCILKHFKRYFFLLQNKWGKDLTYLFLFSFFLKHFCAMESFTSTCKKFLFPWSSATLTSWNHQLHSPFTEVLNKSRGNLSSKCFLQCFYKALQLSVLSGVVLCCPLNILFFIVFLHYLFFHRSITNSLPNVALPKVPSLPLNLPQMPSFTTPTWMTSMYEFTCVFFNNLLTVCQLCMALLLFCAAVFGLHGVYDLLVGNYCFLEVNQAWTVSKLCFLVPLNELVLNL